MSERAKCPKCEQPLTQVGKYWICPEHGQVLSEKPSAPMRIFLSYGHDANEELVRQIKAGLEKRGHDVWFDKSEIKFGDNWRLSITDGIVDSQRVLSFLSKHSTRDPGVCLDEIAIAIGVKGGNIQTILVESEIDVKPPASISHIQWLDMHDWKEKCNIGREDWGNWYREKFDEITRVVESEESRRFAGEIETLNSYLKPISSDSRVAALFRKGFVGRKWLFEAIEQWRTSEDRSSRLFWITGDPGVGKSAFAANLTHFGRDKVLAAQFVEWDKPDHRNAQRVVRSLAFQLATRLPDYRKLLLTLPEIAELDRKDPAELFDYLLANPLCSVIHGGRERHLIIIDALDEAGEAGCNTLVEMLARNTPLLPDWIGIVVTSRPDSAVKTPLQGLNPFVLDTRTEANCNDIRDYLQHELASHLQNRQEADQLVEQILDKSEGVFLFIEHFCDAVQQNHLSLDHPEQFPQGLGGIFCQWFQRQFPDLEKFRKDVRPALRAILAAREPLPVEILQRLFNWQDEELRDFTRTLGSLFTVTREAMHSVAHHDPAIPHFYAPLIEMPPTDQKVMTAYHKSVVDWLTDDGKSGSYFVSLLEGHRVLADWSWNEFLQSPCSMSRYAICNLPQHLVAIGDTSRLQQVLNDKCFWEHSPVFYRDEFYASVAQVLSPSECLAVLEPVHNFYAEQAVAKSPTSLGYALFPHEPGVTFDKGTPMDGYMIPFGVIEPPYEVLFNFIRICRITFLSASAFLRSVPNPAVIEWYRNYWKRFGLLSTLNAIENYYGFHLPGLSDRALELSVEINKAMGQASAIQWDAGA